ncbi:hypothetical protein GKR09_05095 [Staphylococcus aureus]|nr:hypothetical protein [Staphylococcus aureus]
MDLAISEILKVVVDALEYSNFDIYDIEFNTDNIVVHLEDMTMSEEGFDNKLDMSNIEPVATLTIDKTIDNIHIVKSFVEVELYNITKQIERKRLSNMLGDTKIN